MVELYLYGSAKGREDFFKKVLRHIHEHIEIPKKLELHITDNPEDCPLLREDTTPDERKLLEEYCEQSHASFSLSLPHREIILIRLDETRRFVLKDEKAAIGLLSHEIMHTIQRNEGLDDTIVDYVENNAQKYETAAKELGLSKKDISRILDNILPSAILSLTDVIANRTLIEAGLGRELYRYYKDSVGEAHTCDMPEFITFRKGVEEHDLPKEESFIAFELGIMSVHLPFQEYGWAKDLIESIELCHEINIKDIAKEFHELIDIYTVWKGKRGLIPRFMDCVIENTFEIIVAGHKKSKKPSPRRKKKAA